MIKKPKYLVFHLPTGLFEVYQGPLAPYIYCKIPYRMEFYTKKEAVNFIKNHFFILFKEGNEWIISADSDIEWHNKFKNSKNTFLIDSTEFELIKLY